MRENLSSLITMLIYQMQDLCLANPSSLRISKDDLPTLERKNINSRGFGANFRESCIEYFLKEILIVQCFLKVETSTYNATVLKRSDVVVADAHKAYLQPRSFNILFGDVCLAYPIDTIKKCKEARKVWTGGLISFSAGAFFNLIPFIDFSDVNKIAVLQLLCLGIDGAVLLSSLVVFLGFTWKLGRIRGKILSRSSEE